MFKRECPICKKEITYNKSSSFYSARWRNSCCLECKKDLLKDKYSGNGNPFYGKHHSIEIMWFLYTENQ